jgi:hypothetical protein
MRLILLALSLALTVPAPALAEDAPKAEKVRKVCRETPARTGSHRPGKRVCKTVAEWKEYDGAEVSVETGPNGAPITPKSSRTEN